MISRFVAEKAALVVGSNQGILAELEDLHPDIERILVPNGVSATLLKACEALDPKESRGSFRVTYAGALGYYQGLDVLMDAASLLPNVEFLIVGEGPQRQRLEEMRYTGSLTNVKMLGYLPQSDVLQLYADSDILYASLLDTSALSQYAVPSKPYEYMAAGKPVIYSGGQLSAAVFGATGACLVLKSATARDVADAIELLRTNPDQAALMSKAGPRHARLMERGRIMREFTRTLRSAVLVD
jgi:colanic acid biosynthesis glycosyl transferase WcaI